MPTLRLPQRSGTTLHTTSMAPSGEAVAQIELSGERRAVLVRGGAPDETLEVEIDTTKRPGRAEIVQVVKAAQGRVKPPCPYAAACGGCDWMHLSREAQRAAHVSLAPKGPAPQFHAAPSDLRYRIRARLHLEGRNGKLVASYFGARSHEIVPIDACIALDPRLEDARRDLESLFAGARGDGEAALALGVSLPVAEVRWTRDLPPEVFGRLEKALGRWQGFRVWCGDVRRPAVFGDPTPWLKGADGEPLALAPGGFSQPQEPMNAALAQRVQELVGDAKQVLELYAGAGNFTVLLARDHTVRAVESDEAACDAARRNLAARGLSARVTCADAASFEIPGQTDVVVLDPPRTGAREVAERLAARPVKRVVYVSCDRATLARDLGLLEARYEIASVDLFEMFPQTSHIETVVSLHKRR